mmetsp:Transcript_3077/g.8167  ORF Transcript_3077/g.8167 Transcript_3077/m.8167 type:complete len:240 (-) Transcript_3077:74-793(-)
MKSGLGLFAAAVVLLAAQSALSVRTPAPARPEHRGEEWPPMPYLPVEVNYYLESLCPDCAKFAVGPFDAAIKDLEQYMKITLVPYGNTKVSDNGTYVCQHGPEECYLDLYENCVLHYTGYDVKQYWPFMKCADAIVVSRFPNVDGISKAILDACNKELPPSVDPQKVAGCAHGSLGQELLRAARFQTEFLDPPHTYVPWVTLDKKPIGENFSNISKLICAELDRLNNRGPPPPCKKIMA